MFVLRIKSVKDGIGLQHVPFMDARGMHYTMRTEWNVPDDDNMADATNGGKENSYVEGYI